MYVVRKQALEISDLGSETTSAGEQNQPKTAISLRCRGETQAERLFRGEVLLQLQLGPACRKCIGMCRGREGMGVLVGKMWFRTPPVLPP